VGGFGLVAVAHAFLRCDAGCEFVSTVGTLHERHGSGRVLCRSSQECFSFPGYSPRVCQHNFSLGRGPIQGRAATPLVVRLPLQVMWLALLWWSVGAESP
jgi:hypothetical protein